MGVFVFIANNNKEDGSWSAKAYSKDSGYNDALCAKATSTYELERKLVKLAQDNSSGGGVQTSFNMVMPDKAVIVVSVGGAVAASGGGGGAVAAGGNAAPAKQEEAKKQEPSEEEEETLFSLFD